jgi:Asp-tRNA(Asn)/Glu-tRNA(Gln) amidotransferase C subunit
MSKGDDVRVLSDEQVATLARISGIDIGSEELHEVALRLSLMLDAIERVSDEGIAHADADQVGEQR